MSKENKCQICYNNLEHWEVKKKQSWERGEVKCKGHSSPIEGFSGEEKQCSECKSTYFTKLNEFGDIQYPKHKEEWCLEVQKSLLEYYKSQSWLSDEDKTHMKRLEKNLGINSNNDNIERERERERERESRIETRDCQFRENY